ncbi:MAG: hypothetical protein ABW061_13080 [Polyangiaceae bacterium]
MRIARSVFVASCLLAFGCGGGEATPPAEAPAPPSTAEPAPASTPKAEPVAEAPKSEDAPADTADASPPTKAEPAAEDPNATRTVSYVVVPEGLKISVAGVKFTVSAAAVKVASGWGVKVSVVANASDGKPHSLSSPKAGPLAFAGAVQRKGQSEPDHFGDERSGDGEQAIFGDDPTKFNRTWPTKGTRVLGIGDALDLQVALWGLGTEKDARRPVKQFCHVHMQVDKGLPRAVVEPPKSASGK